MKSTSFLTTLALCLVASIASANFDIEKLIDLSKQTKSVEEIIARLPEDYLRNFVLVYGSRSLQTSTFERPRVILYGNGKSGLTFSYSSVTEMGGNNLALEAIQFDSKNKKFDFYKIQYSADQTQPPVVTQNPKMCTHCHRDNQRPNWGKFDRWAGAYGGELFVEPVELQHFKNFVEKQKDNPFYQPLFGLEPDAKNYLARRPAHTLQRVFTAQNNYRIARMVHELPNYKFFKYAIAGAIDNAGDIEGYIPEKLKKGKRSYQEILNSSLNSIDSTHIQLARLQKQLLGVEISESEIRKNPRLFANWDIHFRFDVIDTPHTGYTHDRVLEQVAKLRYVVEELMNVSMESWSLTLERNSYTLALPGWNSPMGMTPELSELIHKQDPAVLALILSTKGPDIIGPNGENAKNPKRVEALRSASLKELNAMGDR